MTSLILGLALGVAVPAPKETPKEPIKLEGEWVVESYEGRDGPPKDRGPITMTFTEGKIAVKEGKRERPEDALYTADLKKKPATIDIRPEKGPKGETLLGIIEVTGDTMKLCFARPGGERPKDFKADANTEVMLIILKRVKPEK